MEFTGERFLPTVEGELKTEHFHRYAFSFPFVRNKIVLDIASGEGYGSAFLARYAHYVVGVDIDSEAVTHANRKYATQQNLKFLTGGCDNIPLADASIDIVTSFETIEHHDK